MYGWVTPQDYGAVGDGAANDSAAFTNALASGYPVWVPHTPLGYNLPSTINLNGGSPAATAWQIIQGDQGVLLKSTAMIAFSVNGDYVKVSGFTFDMAGSPKGSTAIYLNTTTGKLTAHRYSNMLFQNCYSAFTDPASGSNVCIDMQFVNIHCWMNLGTQITLHRSNGQIRFSSVYIDNTQQGSMPDYEIKWPSAVFGPQFLGLELDRFDVTGSTTNIAPFSPSRYALSIKGAGPSPFIGAVFLNRVLVDTWPVGPGILLENIESMFGSDVECDGAYGNGISLVNVANSNFVNIAAVGAGSTPGITAIGLYGCTNVQMTNVRATNHYGFGILFNSNGSTPTTYCRLTNVYAQFNHGWGMYEFATTPACDHNVKVNVSLTDNNIGTGTGSLNQSGANSATVCLIPHGGTYIPSFVGPGSIA
jgi:hypothetical protein